MYEYRILSDTRPQEFTFDKSVLAAMSLLWNGSLVAWNPYERNMIKNRGKEIGGK